MCSFVFLLPFNNCNSTLSKCSSSFCSFSCTFSVGVNQFCVVKILTFVVFFHIRKHMEMHCINSYSARSKYYLTIRKPCMYAFLRSSWFLGFGCQINKSCNYVEWIKTSIDLSFPHFGGPSFLSLSFSNLDWSYSS